MRETFQISLWKADNYTCVKTKDRYFTPSNERFTEKGKQRFQGFEMSFSLDKEHILLVEKRAKGIKKQLVVILDAFSLAPVSEYVIPYSIDYISGIDIDPLDEESYDDGWSEFLTFKQTPNVYLWNKAKYLMYGQTLDGAVSILQFEVWDIENNKKYVISREEMKAFLVDVKVSPDNNDFLFMGGYNEHHTYVYKVDIKNEKTSQISCCESTDPRPKFFYIDQSWNQQFHSRIGNHDGKQVCRVYTSGINESVDINLASNKGKFTDYKPNLIGKTDGNNFIGIYYNDRNEIWTKVSGQLNFTKTLSDLENDIELSGVRDYGIMNNNGVIILSNLGGASFNITFISNTEGKSLRSYNVNETSFIHFNYPVVILVKGGNEILTYSIQENMYYYTKLYAPILFRTSMSGVDYDILLKVFIDLGDYICFTEFMFSLGYGTNSASVF